MLQAHYIYSGNAATSLCTGCLEHSTACMVPCFKEMQWSLAQMLSGMLSKQKMVLQARERVSNTVPDVASWLMSRDFQVLYHGRFACKTSFQHCHKIAHTPHREFSIALCRVVWMTWRVGSDISISCLLARRQRLTTAMIFKSAAFSMLEE